VTNLAARLCDEAAGDQILISQRVFAAVESLVDAEPLEPLTLKGLRRPVIAYRLRGLKG
jgi:class 3 adenylate cyclase